VLFNANLKTTGIRRTALRHALLSYAFGTLIIAKQHKRTHEGATIISRR
jgi:uncharacterized membrane protein